MTLYFRLLDGNLIRVFNKNYPITPYYNRKAVWHTLSLSHVMCFKFIHPPWAVKKVWGIPIWYVIKKWNDDLSLSLISLFKFLVGWSSTMSVFAFATQIWWTDTGSCRQHRAMLTAHQLEEKLFSLVWYGFIVQPTHVLVKKGRIYND